MRYITLIIISILSLIIININLKLYSENFTETEKRDDIILQLNFLEYELKRENLGTRMQQLFPEGFVFVNALYGLAWCELALSETSDQTLKERAIEEAVYAYNNIDSEKGRWNFPEYLNPKYGIFYCGWKNYLLSKILSIDTNFYESNEYISKYKFQSHLITEALEKSESPFLESYERSSWPADMFVAMASISNHDKIFASRYHNIIDNWIRKVQVRLDPETGVVPHKVDYKTGESLQGARGSSSGLILRMLGEIDTLFAKDQFNLVKDNFISNTFGLPSISEYPKGKHGLSDVDSGPVIFGVGFSATIVMIGTLAMYDNQDLAEQQYKTIHSFGFAKNTTERKMYLLGMLPMADAFIAWGRATMLNNPKNSSDNTSETWRLEFHIISTVILLVIWVLFFRNQLYRYIKTVTKSGYRN